ncbi:MAG: hypothetical protein EOM20_03380 [Spartobacteria bacterium]|nr:hypothetical protein [Spartobacteria bacterium]
MINTTNRNAGAAGLTGYSGGVPLSSAGNTGGGGFDLQNTLNTVNLLMQLFGAGYSIKQQSDNRKDAKDMQSKENMNAIISGRRPRTVDTPQMDYVTPLLAAGQSLAGYGNQRADIQRQRKSDDRNDKEAAAYEAYRNAMARAADRRGGESNDMDNEDALALIGRALTLGGGGQRLSVGGTDDPQGSFGLNEDVVLPDTRLTPPPVGVPKILGNKPSRYNSDEFSAFMR